MVPLLLAVVNYFRAIFVPRHNLALEVVSLRQQLAVFKRKQPRPRLRKSDRLVWILLRRLWPHWSETLILVEPETVVAWHRAGFRLFWRFRSRFRRPGRPKISGECCQRWRHRTQFLASSGKSVGDGERQRAVAMRNRRNFLQVESKDLC